MRTRVVSFGVFVALALIFSYIETLVTLPLVIPGVKLGLANLIVIIALVKTNIREAYILAVVRVVLAGFIFGSMFSILYSLAGGLLSLTVMILLRQSHRFEIVGISIAGGVFHNVGQMLAAALLIENYNVLYYLPVILISGMLTGLLIGIAAQEMLKRLVKIEL